VKASVDKFGLSAHADANEMMRFVETMNPTYTLLVHGDDDAWHALVEKIHPRFHPMLSENGETYPFEKRKDGRGVLGKRYKRNTEQERLRTYIGQVLLYQKGDGKPLKFGLCQNAHPKFQMLHCDTPKGKMDRIEVSYLADSLGPWNESIDTFSKAAIDVLTFSRPYLEKINWDRLPDYTLSLAEIFNRLEVNDVRKRFATALALQSIPSEHRHVDIEGRIGYRLNDDLRFQLSNMDLPIQAINMNANHAMDLVRQYFSGDTNFIRCGIQEPGTDNEHMLLSFDFPTRITEQERKQVKKEIKKQT